MSNLNGFTASNETILRECEAVEIERLFGHTTIDFAPHELISRVFDRVNNYYNSFSLCIIWSLFLRLHTWYKSRT